MGVYFKPLRRKFGVVMLGMACVFMGGWVRGLTVFDQIQFGQQGRGEIYQLHFSHFGIMWIQILFPGHFQGGTTWSPAPIEVLDGRSAVEELEHSVPHYTKWHVKTWGIGTGDLRDNLNQIYATYWSISYWSIVIPLTLLSAWLLLSRPRAPKLVPPTTENAQ